MEEITVFVKPGRRELPVYVREASKIPKDRMAELSSRIWSIHLRNELCKEDHKIHPSPFPQRLAKMAIMLYSFIGDTVLDPFMGIGSTCLAAKALGRNFIGVDINRTYVEYAVERLGKLEERMVA